MQLWRKNTINLFWVFLGYYCSGVWEQEGEELGGCAQGFQGVQELQRLAFDQNIYVIQDHKAEKELASLLGRRSSELCLFHIGRRVYDI